MSNYTLKTHLTGDTGRAGVAIALGWTNGFYVLDYICNCIKRLLLQ